MRSCSACVTITMPGMCKVKGTAGGNRDDGGMAEEGPSELWEAGRARSSPLLRTRSDAAACAVEGPRHAAEPRPSAVGQPPSYSPFDTVTWGNPKILDTLSGSAIKDRFPLGPRPPALVKLAPSACAPGSVCYRAQRCHCPPAASLSRSGVSRPASSGLDNTSDSVSYSPHPMAHASTSSACDRATPHAQPQLGAGHTTVPIGLPCQPYEARLATARVHLDPMPSAPKA